MDSRLQRQLEELDEQHRQTRRSFEAQAGRINQEQHDTRRAFEALYERHRYFLQELNPDYQDLAFQHELEKENGLLMQRYQQELQQLTFAAEEQEDIFRRQKRRLEDTYY